MKNRPTKPGNYWWESTIGKRHAIEVSMRMRVPACSIGFDDSVKMVSIGEFERDRFFKRWLGPAHPPKKIDRYLPYQDCEDVEFREAPDGDWVRYEDVEEFILGIDQC